MKTKIAVVLVLISLIAGCVSVPPMQLIPGAGGVLVAKSDPGDNYEIIGPVSGFDGEGCGGFGYMGSFERATTNLRNKTFSMGGNYAQLISLTEPHLRGNCFDNEFVIRATAYRRVRSQPSPVLSPDSNEERLTKKLRELKKLFDDSVLTKDEYENQKSKLLEKGF